MRKKSEAVLNGLEGLRTEFEVWRKQRRRGERIPRRLWDAATRAGRRHGVHGVSRALGLEYSHLKRRVDEGTGPGDVASRSQAFFVEVDGEEGQSSSGCVVELEKGNGARMRISVTQASSVDWCRVKEAFLGA